MAQTTIPFVRLIRQRLFFNLLVGILILLAALMLWPFLNSILVAIAAVVVTKPIYNRLLKAKGINGNEGRAAGCTVLIAVLVIAIPLVLFLGGAINQAAKLFAGLGAEALNLSMDRVIVEVEGALQDLGLGEVPIDEGELAGTIEQAISGLAAALAQRLVSLGASIPVFITNVLIILIIMNVGLQRYKRPGNRDIIELVPFPPEITQLFLDKMDLMITAMFKGTYVIAIVAGLAMGIVLWIAGVPYVLFFTVICIFLATIPMVGMGWLVWPIGILLIVNGDVWQGVLIIASFVLVIANIDNFLRPRLVPKEAYLNPALVLISVLGGVAFMGPIGVIYGPVIMIALVTCIDVYTKYILRSDLEGLEKEGHVDLGALGLSTPEDEEEEPSVGEMLRDLAKGASASAQKGSSAGAEAAQPADDLATSPT
jgi:predicted PurR-regulated permease PerM